MINLQLLQLDIEAAETMITEAQKQEFLERRAKGPQLSESEVEEFNKTGVKLNQEQYLKFLEVTDEKCNDDS